MSPRKDTARPLRWLVLDFDSFFASIEQTERPHLRGQPVGVAPLESESTCVIAASYEARRYGVKCGTLVAEARLLCPGIHIVPATPKLYTTYRKRVEEVIDDVLPVPAKCEYIDEMKFKLLGDEMRPAHARELALLIKARLRRHLGPVLTGSIGIAPNDYLAKIASDMGKPNGLTVFSAEDLPHALYRLKLRDLPGINRRMEIRFNAAGIFTIRDLYEASLLHARRGAGSILGDQWWYLLHGEESMERPTHTRSLGHSHVLPTELRNPPGVKAVMLRLLGKALARLREKNLRAGGLGLYVSGGAAWKDYGRIEPTCDDLALVKIVTARLAAADFWAPKKIGLYFDNLREPETVVPSLFEKEPLRILEFGVALDRVNQRYGKHTIYVGSIHDVRQTGSEKIAFGKGSLFPEGKGDHVLNRSLAFAEPPPPDPYADLRLRRAAASEAARRFTGSAEREFFEEDLRLDPDEIEAIRTEIDRTEPRPDPLPAFGPVDRSLAAV